MNDMIKQFTDGEKSGSAPSNSAYMRDVLKNLKVESEEECPVCFDIMEMPTLVPGCLHRWYVESDLNLQTLQVLN